METKGTRGIRRICVHFAGRPREWRAISISRGKEVIRAQAAVFRKTPIQFLYFQRETRVTIYGSTRNKAYDTFDIRTDARRAFLRVTYFTRKIRGRDDGVFTEVFTYAVCVTFDVENICYIATDGKERPREIPRRLTGHRRMEKR